jgi:type II secretory ATPase GspE/PulE/Tfp pilus assembly ATPase PilB-like protein
VSSLRDSGAHIFRREYDLDGPQDSPHPIPKLCALILADALRSQALGIRLAPISDELGGVECERDGQWQPFMQVPAQGFGAIINRFKVMAALDIARVPVQEGELHVRLNGLPRVLKIRSVATSAPYDLLTITVPV